MAVLDQKKSPEKQNTYWPPLGEIPKDLEGKRPGGEKKPKGNQRSLRNQRLIRSRGVESSQERAIWWQSKKQRGEKIGT